jgi:hypothetical protein
MRFAVFLLLAGPVWALYEPEKLTDTSRRWAVNAGFSAEFDDNINTTASNRQSGVREGVTAGVQANVPLEQTFFRMRYNYGASYAPQQRGSNVDQSHSFDGLLSHTFSPRLVVNLSDTLRRGIEPDAVDVTSAQNIQLQQRGDYLFDTLSADGNYNLSRRLTGTVRGGWEVWQYDVSAIASNNDRTGYHGAFELSYELTPRTFAGLGYEYSVSDYSSPGSNSLRNSTSHNAYAMFSHVFNPQLSANVQAGAERREFSDGTDMAPSISSALNYNYSRDATATLGFRYSITATEVDAFRSTDAATAFVQAGYRFTQRLNASAHGLYSLATFGNPLPGAFAGVKGNAIPKQEQDAAAGLSLTYQFTRWFSGVLNYDFDWVHSDDKARSFDRDRVGLLMNLSY